MTGRHDLSDEDYKLLVGDDEHPAHPLIERFADQLGHENHWYQSDPRHHERLHRCTCYALAVDAYLALLDYRRERFAEANDRLWGSGAWEQCGDDCGDVREIDHLLLPVFHAKGIHHGR